jgi:Domain of unknown function (DUF4328)
MWGVGIVGLWNAMEACLVWFGDDPSYGYPVRALWASELEALVRPAEKLLWVAAVVLFCRWLHGAYEDNRRLQGAPLKVGSGAAVASFFIPFISFYRPYQVLRNIYASSDPGTLPDPPQYEPTGTEVLYRSNPRVESAPRDWKTWFPVRLWWASYLVAMGAPFFELLLAIAARPTHPIGFFSDPVVSVSAVLAIMVIRGVQVRQGERLRRIEAAVSTQL